ncbi:MAG: DUF2848 domain-containing protein [Methylobacteriaceae bacterium]|nr:DUF2848 domain-containing protein [Methylobacteriaceae bacterium]
MPDERALDVHEITRLVVAGWTGRDRDALEAHIRELEALGIARPKTTPIFYRVAASLLTRADKIEVIGDASSGEAEIVIYALADGMWIGLGSDHTDRKAEAIGVTLSKQMCAKPVGATLWRFGEVEPHWDKLVLRSFVTRDGGRRLYQEGPVATMRPPKELLRLYANDGALSFGTAMFCGTLAVHGAIEGGEVFEMELEDPVLGRKLTHAYRVEQLPVEG